MKVVGFDNSKVLNVTGTVDLVGFVNVTNKTTFSGTSTAIDTLTMTSGTVTFASDATVGAFGEGTAGIVVNEGKTLSLGGLTLTAENSTTYGGVISGSGNVTKEGEGSVILSGANTYTGTTTVNAGTLDITGSIASNVTVASGATLKVVAGSFSSAATISLANGGAVTGILGANATLSASETTGATLSGLTLNGGKIVISTTNALTLGDSVTFTSGTIDLTALSLAAGGTTSGTIFDGGSADLATALNSLTLVGVTAGSFSYDETNTKIIFTLLDLVPFTWNATNDSTWAVGTAIGGTPYKDAGAAVTFGALTADEAITISGTVAPLSITINDTSEFTYTFSGGKISTEGALTITDGQVVFNGTDLTGFTGTLTGGDGTSLTLTDVGTMTTVFSTFTGDLTVNGNTAISLGTEKAGTTRTISGTGTVNIGLTSAYGNAVNLGTGFTGTVAISSGYFTLNSVTVGENATVTLAGGVNAQATETSEITYNLVLNGTHEIHTNGSNVVTFSKSITGASATLNKKAAGTATFTDKVTLGTYNQTAGTTIFNGGTSTITTFNISAGTTLNVSGGSLTVGSLRGTNSVAGGGNINVGADGTLVTTGDLVLRYEGNGTSTMTVAGTVDVQGTLRISRDGVGNITISEGGILQAKTLNFGQNWDGDKGSIVDLNGGSLIVGAGGIVKGTHINKSSLNLNSGTVGTSADSTSFVADVPVVLGGEVTVNTGKYDLETKTHSTETGSTITFNSAITGSGSLIKEGAGTLVLSGANTYNGTTTIKEGILQIGNGETTGNLGTGSVSIADGASLVFKNTGTVSATISGAGSVDIQAGTVTLSLAEAGFTGSVTIAEGTTLNADSILAKVAGAGVYNYTGTDASVTLANFSLTGTLNATNATAQALNLTGGTDTAEAIDFTIGTNWNAINVTSGKVDVADKTFTANVDVATGAELSASTILSKVSGTGVYNYTGATAATVDLTSADFAFTGTLNATNATAQALNLTGGTDTAATVNFTIGTNWDAINITSGKVDVAGKTFDVEVNIAMGAELSASTILSKVSGTGVYNYTGATAATVDLTSTDFAFTGTLNATNATTQALTINTGDDNKSLDFVIGDNWSQLVKTGAGALSLGGELNLDSGIDIQGGTISLTNGTKLTINGALGTAFSFVAGTVLELVDGVTIVYGGNVTWVVGEDSGTTTANISTLQGITNATIRYILGTWELANKDANVIATAMNSNIGNATVITFNDVTEPTNLAITEAMALGSKTFKKLDIQAGTISVTDVAHLTTTEVAIADGTSFTQSGAGTLVNKEETATTISGAGIFVVGVDGVTTTMSDSFTGTLQVAESVTYTTANLGGTTKVAVATGSTLDYTATASLANVTLSGAGALNVDASLTIANAANATAIALDGFTGTINGAAGADLTIGTTSLGFTIGADWDSVIFTDTIDLSGEILGDNNIEVATGAVVTMGAGTTTGLIDVAGTLNADSILNNVSGAGTYNYTGTDASVTLANFSLTGTLNADSEQVLKVVGGTDATEAIDFTIGNNWTGVEVTSGLVTLNDWTNVKALTVSGGTVTAAGGAYVGNITVAGGALTIASNLSLTGLLDLTRAALDSVTVADGVTLTMTAGSVTDGYLGCLTGTGNLAISNATLFNGVTAEELYSADKTWLTKLKETGLTVIWNDRPVIETVSTLDDCWVDGAWSQTKINSLFDNLGEDASLSISTGDTLVIDDYVAGDANGFEDDLYSSLIIKTGASVSLTNEANFGGDEFRMAGGSLTLNGATLSKTVLGSSGTVILTNDFSITNSNFDAFQGTITGEKTLAVSGVNLNSSLAGFAKVDVTGNSTLNGTLSVAELAVAQGSTLTTGEKVNFAGKLTGEGNLNGVNSTFTGNTGSTFTGNVSGTVNLASSQAFANATVNGKVTVSGSGTSIGTLGENATLTLNVGAVNSSSAVVSVDTINVTHAIVTSSNGVVNGKFALIQSAASLADMSVTVGTVTNVTLNTVAQEDGYKYELSLDENGTLWLNAMTYANSNGQVVEEFDSSVTQGGQVQQTITSAGMISEAVLGHINQGFVNSTFGGGMNGAITGALSKTSGMQASTGEGSIAILGQDVGFTGTNVWGQALYSYAEHDGAQRSGDSNENSYGGMIGFERNYSDFSYGAFIGGVSSKVDGNNGFEVESEAIYLGLYGGIHGDLLFTNFGAMYGYSFNDTTRNGVSGDIDGDYDSYMGSIFGEFGAFYNFNENLYGRASIGLQYNYVNSESYEESEGGNAVDSSDFDSLTAGVDFRLGYRFQRGFVEFRAGVVAELLDTEIESDFRILDNPSALYSSQGAELDNSKLILGVDGGYRINDNVEVRGGVLGEFGDSHERYTGNVRFIYSF